MSASASDSTRSGEYSICMCMCTSRLRADVFLRR